jgi:hypothetical protein
MIRREDAVAATNPKKKARAGRERGRGLYLIALAAVLVASARLDGLPCWL